MMARFRATIKGQRGEASRLGSVKSGIRASVDGWNVGVIVAGRANYRTAGDDCFDVYTTAGSNGGAADRFIGSILLDLNGKPTFVAMGD
jgi:hypothetical protein